MLTEYVEHGVNWLVPANNDRAAGYARLLELVHPEPGRPFPSWHPRTGETGAPRLFMFRTCEQLVAQMRSAPIAKDGSDAGEAVDGKWENAHGHAHAAARYGVMSRPAPSREVDPQAHVPYHLKMIDWEAEARERRREFVNRCIYESDERPSRPLLIDV